jgi:hypothetical protein
MFAVIRFQKAYSIASLDLRNKMLAQAAYGAMDIYSLEANAPKTTKAF